MKLSIIIVSYNSEEFIKKCISSVLQFSSDREVIVFDNASSDKTVSILKNFGSRITLVESKENLGFAKGNNEAAKIAQGEYLLFLNPDTEFFSRGLTKLIEYYQSNKDIGIIAPKLIMGNGQVQPTVKRLPTVAGAFAEYILKKRNAYSEYIPDLTKPTQVDAVYGAAMLIRRDFFNTIGKFDERFFLYYEDLEFCRRVHNLGKKVIYFPLFSITHLVGATKSSQDKYLLNKKSAQIYHGKLGYLVLQLIFILRRLLQLR